MEYVLLGTIGQASGNNMAAQALTLALGYKLFEGEELLVAAVWTALLVVRLRGRLLRLVRVGRCACPGQHAGDANNNLLSLKWACRCDRGEQDFGRLHIAEAIQDRELRLQEGRSQSLW